ncbi:hypothetical protein LVT46_04855 [Klebsiella quasipneumoniae subsp. similipneumoniae]|uniref:hypothetical protein n=1 Tax=Klebsiella quasipneumoniae TaxID=1463165 RepID=UPI001E2DC2EE|nr:hypothetical protein [Klebsiella quasipneumoniae]MCD9997631.1 hypothetical protein [Klebsiella quasipneumoniae subsp. similipneumoniae]
MTTDITELAQREKFEAWAHSQKLSLAYGDCGYAFSSTEMAWRAWKAASAELVEALEKAQAKNALVAGGIEAAAKLHERIAELESRTVTAESMQESAYRAGLTAGWNLGLSNNNDGFNKCLSAHGAGIKWEAE